MSMVEFTRKVPDLIIMRHSKSAYPLGVPDHDRPLSERGSRDVQAARQWFTQQAFPIDQAWVSSALRAQQTWAGIRPGIRETALPTFDESTVPELYEASVAQLLSLLTTATARTLLVIAHNPGLEQLINSVVGRDVHGWLSHIRAKFPTGAVCVIRHEDWATLAEGQAELVTYAVTRAS